MRNLTRKERQALRSQEAYSDRQRKKRERILIQAERELTFGKTDFPEHAKPLRTPSGTRFGW